MFSYFKVLKLWKKHTWLEFKYNNSNKTDFKAISALHSFIIQKEIFVIVLCQQRIKIRLSGVWDYLNNINFTF